MKHTKGPWIIVKVTHDGEVIDIADSIKGPRSIELQLVSSNGPENWKNARLIAAAPELLESIQQFVSRLEEVGEFVPQHLKHIILKATGGES